MSRRFLALPSALSLMLCMATCALRVWNHWYSAGFEWWRVPRASEGIILNPEVPDREIKIAFQYGAVTAEWVREEPQWFGETEGHVIDRNSFDVSKRWISGTAGMSRSQQFDDVAAVHWPVYKRQVDENHAEDVRTIVVSFWVLASIFAVLPLRWLVITQCNRHRIKSGFCVQCGYDTRATPDRCPECGAAATRKPISN